MRHGVVVSVIAVWLALLWGPVGAGEPPSEPALQIETGMHTALIRRIGVDAAERYLVTGSHDKTVRVWDLATGRQLRVLRPPFGNGDEGKIYAVALAPDGKTVAAGGWTGDQWDGSYAIYLFDRETGRLMRRLTGLPNVVRHLTYSHDGQVLAAALGSENGIRLYRTDDYAQVAEDRDYGGDSYGAVFDRAGRLATASFDGFVRLYDTSFRLLAKVRVPGGQRPYGVSFSPDGRLVAVGFYDSSAVNVLSGSDLSFQFAPETREVEPGKSLYSVAWSADGSRLYAGGNFSIRQPDGSWKRVIRVWAAGGRGAVTDWPVADNSIAALLPLQAGGFAYGTADPTWGVFDRAGTRVRFQGPAIADYRNNLNGLLLSEDGSTVQFGFQVYGESPARFAVATRLLTRNPPSDTSLRPPRTSAPGLTVTDWEDTVAPQLNGRALKLDDYEISRSVALAPDGTAVVLGTEWSLRCFDRTGQARWQVAVPSIVWAVNVAGNGQVVAAALGNGTIRWYRLADGQELLAFFPHKDQKRWVLWTPAGYYDASPGAEDLVGWRRNNGKEQAGDFFPVGQFRHTYYRPDVVARVLATRDVHEAVRLANEDAGRKQQQVSLTQQLPPVVTIVSPQDGTAVSQPELRVRFTLRSPSGEPVTELRALVDGRPVATNRGVKATPSQDATQELLVPIPAQDSEITILAENRYTISEPATVRVKWQGRPPTEFVVKPKLYVLAIGVSRYEDPALRLELAAKDARDFAAAVQRQQGRLYREVVMKVLTDGTASKDNILDGLEWVQRETTAKDVAMVFLAGHGVTDASGTYYFLPVGAKPDVGLKRTGVIFSDILTTVTALAGKTVVFLDTCHAGNIMGTRRGGAADINAVVNELASAENGAVVFASSTGRQFSQEKPEWGNGAFTKALVEGLQGEADLMQTGRITVNMLDAYIAERVKTLTRGTQTPTTSKPKTVPDFPIALRR